MIKVHGHSRVSTAERVDRYKNADVSVGAVGETVGVNEERESVTRLPNRSESICTERSGKRTCPMSHERVCERQCNGRRYSYGTLSEGTWYIYVSPGGAHKQTVRVNE